MSRLMLFAAFLCSGAAGLVYELVWSRYLALFIGHSAEAQVLVIGTFLGGLSIGALAVGRRSARVRRPLVAYAAVELGLAAWGLSFHAIYEAVTRFAYGALFPALPGPAWVGVAQWTLASALVLLPSIPLGATFPLLAAGAIRAVSRRPGGTIAGLYFVNSLGGAIAVLVAGFVLIGRLGLPGTSAAAAALNVAAAGGAMLVVWASRRPGRGDRTNAPRAAGVAPATGRAASGAGGPVGSALWRLLLVISALTAVASFAYEIGWIRMLSLVMGSATHSFELMLSAFILGLALGALAIRRPADRSARPLALLAGIQWLMGLLALATLPAYVASFGWVADLVRELPATDAGYRTFNVARYGIALAVMLPSTFLAGTTLPLITTTLLRAGAGERAIGWVYATNTAGAIAGVAAAGLVLLPTLGLKGLIVAGATLDMLLGVALLVARRRGVGLEPARSAAGVGRRPPAWAAPGLAVLTAAVAAGITGFVRLDRSLLTSGVFRYGTAEAERPVLYYADGRTATVGVHLTGSDSLFVLSTNGKPDASLTARWLRAAVRPIPPAPIQQQDESTQMLTALVTLAHAPEARRAAVIGHGSGISAHFLLAGSGLDSLVTVEIEPRVVDASGLYYPANARVFDDPRSRIAIADAKSYFAGRRDRYDLILSEPSNPWVSGTASLFSVEFYRHVRRHLSDGGVFGQWFHLYETSDELVLSVLAALHRSFPDYRAFLAGDTDLMIVATPAESLPEPDWELLARPGLRRELAHVLPLRPDHLRGLRAFERAELAPLLDGWPRPNSDYRPVLDLGSERTRFEDAFASGAYGLLTDRFRIAAALGGWRLDPSAARGLPIPGLAPQRQRAVAIEARRALDDPGRAPPGFAYGDVHRALRAAGRLLRPPPAAGDVDGWVAWLAAFSRLERTLHGGTAGYADPAFYGLVRGVLGSADAPPTVRDAVAFVEGVAGWEFGDAARAAQRLLEAVDGAAGRVQDGAAERLLGALDPATLLDGAVVSFLRAGEPQAAREAFDRLLPRTGRPASDFRSLLLRAHVRRAMRALDGAPPTP